MSDYVSGLRQDLVEAAARQQAAGRGARVARPLRPRAWSPVAALGTVAALAAAILLVVGLRAVSPPRPPEAPKLLGSFQIGGQPRDAVTAGGRVYVADFTGGLLQITPDGPRLAMKVTAAVLVSAATDGDAVWVMSVRSDTSGPRSELRELQASTGRPGARVPLQRESGPIAVGADGVWLRTTLPTRLARHAGGLERIDLRTHRVTAIAHGEAQDIAASDRSVWTRNGETVTQRDDRGRVMNRVRHLSPSLGFQGQRTMLADGDGAWVVGQSDGLLYRIKSGRVVERLRVGALSGVIARTRSTVWVTAMSDAGRYQLVRVDPDQGTVTGRLDIGTEEPQSIVPAGKELWVITGHGNVRRVSQG
jgi:hypothetical protein